MEGKSSSSGAKASPALSRFKLAAKKTISIATAKAVAEGQTSPGGTKRRMHFFDVANMATQQKARLQKWGQSFTVQHEQFKAAFERLDRNECNTINSMQFERACKRVAVLREPKISELLRFLDPDKTDRVPYRNFLKLIAPNTRPRHRQQSSSDRVRDREMLKNHGILRSSDGLLRGSPMRARERAAERARKQASGIVSLEQTESELNLNRYMRQNVKKRGLGDVGERRKHFNIFLRQAHGI
jgi:hypothetical protein